MITKEEDLKKALEANQKHIVVGGELAQKIIKRTKRKKAIKRTAIATGILGVLAAPFTAGTSLGVSAMALTAGTLTISAAELALICGTAALIFAKGSFDVEVDKENGKVIIRKRK